jgi:hypothetical protein
MNVTEKHEGEIIKFEIVPPENSLPRDPAGSGDHLTPDGKKKRPRIDRRAQIARHEQRVDDRANEVIPTETTHQPGDNLKVKEKKVIGMDD